MTFTDSTVVQSSVRPLNCEPVTFSIPTDPILKTSCEYRGIGRIRESTKKLVGRVPENGRIRVSTGK